jgi:hypothetical protein
VRKLNDGTPIPFRRGVIWYPRWVRRSFVTVQQFEQLPSGVVLLQLLYDKPYKGKWMQEVLRSADYYYEHGGDYHNSNARYVPREVPETRIKEGVFVDDPEFIMMYNEACNGVKVEDG